MDIETLFGLPAHPLLVHLPVAFVPLTAVGAIAIVSKESWRRTFGWLVVAFGAIALVGVQLAMGSGEELEENVERSAVVHHHAQLALMTRPLTGALFLLVLAIVLLDQRRRSREGSESGPSRSWDRARLLLNVSTVIVAIVAAGWIVRTGHEGAKATWEDQKMAGRPVDDDE